MNHEVAERDRLILDAEDAAEARCRFAALPEPGWPEAKEGDPFLVKACDRPQSGQLGEYCGMSSGLVILRFDHAWVSFYPDEVRPMGAGIVPDRVNGDSSSSTGTFAARHSAPATQAPAPAMRPQAVAAGQGHV